MSIAFDSSLASQDPQLQFGTLTLICLPQKQDDVMIMQESYLGHYYLFLRTISV